jgi:hypothetical protein
MIANRARKGECEVNQSGYHRRDGNDQPGKIHLGDQVLVGDQAVTGGRQGIREELPRQEGREGEKWVGEAVGRQLGETAENDAESCHGQNGLQDDPGGAQNGLAIADLDVAPGKEKKHFTITPKFLKVQSLPAFGCFDDRRQFFFCLDLIHLFQLR